MVVLALASLAILAAAKPAPAPAPPAFEGQLSAHGSHACLLRPSHDVVCWGLDLQNPPPETPSGEPALVPGLNDAEEIAVGAAHACAIRSGGQVVCWGSNGLGQLGSAPEKLYRAAPQPVPGLSDAVHLASAGQRTCALKRDGSVVCWGSWDSNVARAPAPSPVPQLSGVTALAMGEVHACALRADGHVACWGDDSRGQLGNGRRDAKSLAESAAQQVVGLEDAVAIAAARLDTCALRKSGQVVCWGDRAGAFAPAEGRGGSKYALSPVPVPGATGAKAVMLTDQAGCLLAAKNGQLACWWPLFSPWAERDFARLHPATPKLAEVKLPALARKTRALVTGEETYALVQGGQVLHWGGRADRMPAQPVRGIADALSVSTGANQSCAVRAKGQVLCWGAIGTGTESSGSFAPRGSRFSSVPAAVGGVKKAVSVSVGAAHACALDAAGAVFCWGNDSEGQLGNGKRGPGLSAALRKKSGIASPVPPPELLPRQRASKVKLPAKAVEVAAGSNTSCAVLKTGALWCWGANDQGQLGDGSTAASLSPKKVAGLEDVRQVALGDGQACALRAGGTLSCWGRDAHALTDAGPDGPDLHVPTAIPGITDATELAVGDGAVCVLRAGEAVCWGRKSRYLGGGERGSRGTGMVRVKGVTGAVEISAGLEQRCVRDAHGTARCWGHNLWGVVGDGTRVDRFAPFEVKGLGPVKSLSAGSQQTCAVRQSGQVVCWGAYASGGIGDGVDPSMPRPLELPIPPALGKR